MLISDLERNKTRPRFRVRLVIDANALRLPGNDTLHVHVPSLSSCGQSDASTSTSSLRTQTLRRHFTPTPHSRVTSTLQLDQSVRRHEYV